MLREVCVSEQISEGIWYEKSPEESYMIHTYFVSSVVFLAEMFGKVIISEMALPHEEKTVKVLPPFYSV